MLILKTLPPFFPLQNQILLAGRGVITPYGKKRNVGEKSLYPAGTCLPLKYHLVLLNVLFNFVKLY